MEWRDEGMVNEEWVVEIGVWQTNKANINKCG
jgi:hypothetical protein